MDELSKVLPKLKVLYAMSALRIDPWLSQLRELADESMNNGVYCELFRMALYDQIIEPEDAHFMLASTIAELDPTNALPNFKECHLLYVQSRMEEILISKDLSEDGPLAIAFDLLFGEYAFFRLPESGDDFSFLKFDDFVSTYYQWESYENTNFANDELDSIRCEANTSVQSAAREWLNNLRRGL